MNANTMKPPITPIGLAYLGQALTAAGIEYELIDLCFSSDPAHESRVRLSPSSADLIALTMRSTDDCFMATQQSFIPGVCELVEAIREVSDAPVVLGGAGFSAMPEAVLAPTGADYGVVGDGEAPIVAMASHDYRGTSSGRAGGQRLRWRGPVPGPLAA